MSPSRGRKESKDARWQIPEWSWLKDTLLDDEARQEQNRSCDSPDEPLSFDKATTIASCFLMDYEAGRPPTLSSLSVDVSDRQLWLYKIVFSSWWQWLGLYPATVLMFVSYFNNRAWTAVLHIYAVVIFLTDFYIRYHLFHKDWFTSPQRRTEQRIQQALFVFLIALGIQSCLWFFLAHPENHFSTLVASLFKPLVFFYLSSRARDTLEALVKIGKILARVVLIELFLILTFAAVACRLYYDDENFQNIAVSWLSLFQLSTTVVNPSLWLPMYEENRFNAVFFMMFIVVCTFYLHSLILSVVFQVFIQAATEVHRRSSVDRQDSIRFAFLVLSVTRMAKQPMGEVHIDVIRQSMQKVRPHYGHLKMNILMELVNPMKKQSLDYGAFRTSIREALNSSVRSARNKSLFDSVVETLSVSVAAINFLFVILLTAQFQASWFKASVVVAGFLITFFGILELGMRCNVCKMSYYPMTRLNAVFDGFAAVGAVVSVYGICDYMAGNESGLDYLFMGRAIDMVRTMRFFSIFRDVVERSVNVFPALAGPVFLVLTTIHIFVYFGMALWGDQIDVDALSQNEDLEPLYYMNNFNTYPEGLVTIFNVLVINDWHQIAKVFLYADRCSQKYIVYPYFVIVVLIAVCIMLNVITAFFVETFVTRLNKNDMENDGVITLQKAPGEYTISTPRKKRSCQLLGRRLSWQSLMGDEPLRQSRSSASSESGEILQFDVFERHGFDRIMEAVANESSDQEEIAKCLCETLDTVAKLSLDWTAMEFLICVQPSMNIYQTTYFHETVAGFLDEYSLHSVIGDLMTKLTSPETVEEREGGDSSRLRREFCHPFHPSSVLDLSAMLLPHVPNLSLIIARQRTDPSESILDLRAQRLLLEVAPT